MISAAFDSLLFFSATVILPLAGPDPAVVLVALVEEAELVSILVFFKADLRGDLAEEAAAASLDLI